MAWGPGQRVVLRVSVELGIEGCIGVCQLHKGAGGEQEDKGEKKKRRKCALMFWGHSSVNAGRDGGRPGRGGARPPSDGATAPCCLCAPWPLRLEEHVCIWDKWLRPPLGSLREAAANLRVHSQLQCSKGSGVQVLPALRPSPSPTVDRWVDSCSLEPGLADHGGGQAAGRLGSPSVTPAGGGAGGPGYSGPTTGDKAWLRATDLLPSSVLANDTNSPSPPFLLCKMGSVTGLPAKSAVSEGRRHLHWGRPPLSRTVPGPRGRLGPPKPNAVAELLVVRLQSQTPENLQGAFSGTNCLLPGTKEQELKQKVRAGPKHR